MDTSKTEARKFGSTVGKIVMALVCALMIGDTFIAPAFADEHGGRERHQHGKYKKNRRVVRHPRRYYPAPVYVPPPVVYAPAPYQSPGISIVFPLY